MRRTYPRLGRTEHGTDLYGDIWAPWHTLVQGQTRSGKSVLSYLMLAPLACRDDVIVTGVDPTGILLGPWGDLPGASLRHTATGDVPGMVVTLAALTEEMDRRITALVANGQDKIEDFTTDQPLIVVVLEEYPGTIATAEAYDAAHGLKPAQRTAPAIRYHVRRLVQEGAKVGFRLLMLVQRADASIVGGAERSNFGFRVSMRVDNPDAVRMLHPAATVEQCQIVQACVPGEGVFESPGQPLTRFKADYCTYQDYTTLLATWRAAHTH